jgi:membrane-bound lytic murein transglycosylase D
MKNIIYLLLLIVSPHALKAQENEVLPDPKPAVLVADNKAFIQNYIKRYQSGTVNVQKDKVILMRYFEQALVKNGIPKELKNLAVVESYLERNAVSSAGAAGPWQLMAGTARNSGLVVNDTLDERFDVYKSTRVAIGILKGLHRKYNDWNLVIAAYNSGSGRVDQAIRQAKSNIYWDVEPYLPAETSAHVKKFMASSFALDGKIPESTRFRTNSTKDTLASKGLITALVNGGFRLDVIAEKLSLPIAQIVAWNPDYDKQIASKGAAVLILPKDRMSDFMYYKSEILKSSLEKNIQESNNDDEKL